MYEMRLQKYLAQAGVASRRKAEEMIRQGRVTVNGLKIVDMGAKVTADDIVEVDGKKISLESKKIYIALNKPVGYITTVSDQFSRKTVLELVKEIKERIYPVGRLDYNTSGLLLLTNDGEFSFRLTHPGHEVNKVYIAEVYGLVSDDKAEAFKKGLKTKEFIASPAKLKVLTKGKNTSVIEITIHEGRNRQVRKMCEAIGHPVINLKRIQIGSVKLGALEEGSWRYLTRQEVEMLK